MFNREDVIWSSAYFEGEGNINWFRQKGRSRGIRKVRPSNHYYQQISIGSTDRDALERFQKAFGLGKIYGPYQKESFKPVYHYKCSKAADVYAITVAMYPWLCERRQKKCFEFLEHFKSHKPG